MNPTVAKKTFKKHRVTPLHSVPVGDCIYLLSELTFLLGALLVNTTTFTNN